MSAYISEMKVVAQKVGRGSSVPKLPARWPVPRPSSTAPRYVSCTLTLCGNYHLHAAPLNCLWLLTGHKVEGMRAEAGWRGPTQLKGLRGQG